MRNVLDYLPKHRREWMRRKLRQAWSAQSYAQTVRQLRSLATSLSTDHLDAAASLRERLEETVTILKLEVPALLQVSLRSTNNPVLAWFQRTSGMWKIGRMTRWFNDGCVLHCLMLKAGLIGSDGYRFLGILIKVLKRLTTINEPGMGARKTSGKQHNTTSLHSGQALNNQSIEKIGHILGCCATDVETLGFCRRSSSVLFTFL